MSYLYVFLGGGLGSICRYGLACWLNHEAYTYPWGTFAANVLSCIVLGAGIALFGKTVLSPEMRLLLLIGFCGGFSTFSTFSNELLIMLKAGEYGVGAIYLLGSVAAGLLAIVLGMRLME